MRSWIAGFDFNPPAWRFLATCIVFLGFAGAVQASTIFNLSGTICFSSSMGGASSSLVASPLPVGGGVQGAILNGACSVGDFTGGSLAASMFGDFAGSDMPLPPQVPVAFDFTIDAGSLSGELQWIVELRINKSLFFTETGFSTNTATQVAGSGFATGLPGGLLSGSDAWSASVQVLCASCEGALVLDLGTSSLQINPVPEPSSLALLALGCIGLCLSRRLASRRLRT